MVNVIELAKYVPKVAFQLNCICEILTNDEYYPPEKVYETAIAFLTEIIGEA